MPAVLQGFAYQLRGSSKLLGREFQFWLGKINVPLTVQRNQMDMGMGDFQSQNRYAYPLTGNHFPHGICYIPGK